MRTEEEYRRLALAAAGAHGMLRALVELGVMPSHHAPSATIIVNEIAEALWPGNDAFRLPSIVSDEYPVRG